MSDEKTPTVPPPAETPGEAALLAAFARLDTKLDQVLATLSRVAVAVEDIYAGQSELRERVAALERIPPRPTLLPPPNGAAAE